MITKICSKCKKELPVSEFQKDRSNKDGFYSSCKSCKREYRQANKATWLTTQYKRIATNKTLLPMRKAWNAVYAALKRGKIDKPEYCSVCNRAIGKDKIQAHHEDYSKPFEITWCCQDCHTDLDRERREADYARICENT